ncbi:prepilin-type N-terminal cleavage/methylation domain-containing protein [Psychrobacillus sp. NPDC093180]|uniref:type IV pilus modification PilV family protein n=1 Tax=Psychrobacillus sp. NPDC093180 TaxID=3364489 RepID=UPI003817F1C7
MKNEKGYSLLEVLGSLVILTIVLISFFQIFVNSNKIAATNNEKLVVIYLADAELERVKFNPFERLPKVTPASLSLYKESKTHIISLNDKEYKVKLDASQTTKEKELKMLNVLVTVTSENNKTNSSVEGYVIYE